MDYLLHILILVCIYSILSVSLDLVAGHAGLLSVAHAAFFGVGAYCVALGALRLGLPFGAGVLLAMLACCLCGVLVAAPALRLGDDYFVLASFGFMVIANSVMTNWLTVTGGPMGLPGIPPPSLCGVRLSSLPAMLGLCLACAVVVVLATDRLARSPFGRALRAIREDELLAKALGKDVTALKLRVFTTSAAAAAVAGGLYAVYISYIDPTTFTVSESVFMLSMVIVGGAATRWGPLLGAVLLVALPELLRFVGLPSALAANVRQILYGGLLTAMMLWRPQGLLGNGHGGSAA